jgi:hypothetical protein
MPQISHPTVFKRPSGPAPTAVGCSPLAPMLS